MERAVPYGAFPRQLLLLLLLLQSAAVIHSAHIVGAGSTLLSPLMSEWAAVYNHDHGTSVVYESVGSYEGQRLLEEGLVDFAVFDSTNKDSVSVGEGTHKVPLVLSPVSITHNIPGISSLQVTLDDIVGVFNGTYRYWNQMSQTAHLPHVPITVYTRADRSGTTHILTEVMSKHSPGGWGARYGVFDGVGKFPVGKMVVGSEGVIAAVRNTTYSIGYTGNTVGVQNIAEIRTQTGQISTAVVNQHLYPIVGRSYALFRVESCSAARHVARFLWWVITDPRAAAAISRVSLWSLAEDVLNEAYIDLKEPVCDGTSILADGPDLVQVDTSPDLADFVHMLSWEYIQRQDGPGLLPVHHVTPQGRLRLSLGVFGASSPPSGELQTLRIHVATVPVVIAVYSKEALHVALSVDEIREIFTGRTRRMERLGNHSFSFAIPREYGYADIVLEILGFRRSDLGIQKKWVDSLEDSMHHAQNTPGGLAILPTVRSAGLSIIQPMINGAGVLPPSGHEHKNRAWDTYPFIGNLWWELVLPPDESCASWEAVYAMMRWSAYNTTETLPTLKKWGLIENPPSESSAVPTSLCLRQTESHSTGKCTRSVTVLEQVGWPLVGMLLGIGIGMFIMHRALRDRLKPQNHSPASTVLLGRIPDVDNEEEGVWGYGYSVKQVPEVPPAVVGGATAPGSSNPLVSTQNTSSAWTMAHTAPSDPEPIDPEEIRKFAARNRGPRSGQSMGLASPMSTFVDDDGLSSVASSSPANSRSLVERFRKVHNEVSEAFAKPLDILHCEVRGSEVFFEVGNSFGPHMSGLLARMLTHGARWRWCTKVWIIDGYKRGREIKAFLAEEAKERGQIEAEETVAFQSINPCFVTRGMVETAESGVFSDRPCSAHTAVQPAQWGHSTPHNAPLRSVRTL